MYVKIIYIYIYFIYIYIYILFEASIDMNKVLILINLIFIKNFKF